MYRCILSLFYKECVTKARAIAIIRVKIRVIYQFLFQAAVLSTVERKKEKSFVKANLAKSEHRLSEKNKRQLFLHVKDRLSRVEPGAGN